MARCRAQRCRIKKWTFFGGGVKDFIVSVAVSYLWFLTLAYVVLFSFCSVQQTVTLQYEVVAPLSYSWPFTSKVLVISDVQKNVNDVSNFDEEFTAEKPCLSPAKDPRPITNEDQVCSSFLVSWLKESFVCKC